MARRAKVDNSTSVKQIERAKGDVAREQEQHLADLREVMTTPAGQRLFWWIFEATGYMRQSFTRDARESDFNEGKRSVGLRLLADMMLAEPTAYAEMLRRATTEDAK